MEIERTSDARELFDKFRHYGAFRTYFKNHENDFTKLRTSLNQAQIGVPYDVYLTRITMYSILAVFAGLLLGLAAATAFTPVITSISLGVTLPSPLASIVGSNQFVLTSIVVLTSLGMGAISWGSLYYYPRLAADQRARNISHNLPHAVVFMYALSHGGMNLIEVMKKTADSKDVYGEVSKEFEAIVREMEYFGTELPLAIQNARERTPSDSFRDFLDDLVNVIDSGGEVTSFFQEESKKSLERAESQQRDFIESLAVMSEIYATVFIVAPLLFIVMLLVMSMIGASTMSAVTLLIYFAIPAGMLAFLYTLHAMSKPYGSTTETLDVENQEPTKSSEEVKSYERRKLRVDIKEILKAPINSVKQKPALILLVTTPLAIVLTLVLAPTYDMALQPVPTTIAYFVAPTLLALTPYSILHELQQHRKKKLVRRFPDKLQALANANQMGLSLTEALEQISRRSTGDLAAEFRKVRNDIRWNSDVSSAMQRFANRMRVPQITRTSKLVAEASRSTAELGRILETAAEDTLNQYRLTKERYRQMSGYIAIIIVSFLVYLSVVVLLDVAYLNPLSNAMSNYDASTMQLLEGQYSGFFQVSIETYRMVFFHSALIQGFGNGLLAGVMGKGDLTSGLKYSLIFITITAIVFAVI